MDQPFDPGQILLAGLQTTSSPIILIDTAGGVLSFNKGAEQLFGYQASEIIGQPVTLLFDLAALPRLGEDSLSKQVAARRRDGTTLVLGILLTPVTVAEKNYAMLFLWAATPEVKPPSAVTVATENPSFQLLFKSNPQPMWVFDRETFQFLEVNDAVVEHYGYTRDEFLTMQVLDIRLPEDRTAAESLLHNIENGLDHVGEVKHRHKDGRLLVVDVTTHSLTFADRPAILAVLYDVTERQQTAEALFKTQARLYGILRSIDNAIFSYSFVTQRMVYVSPAVEKIYGHLATDFLMDNDLWLNVTVAEDRHMVETLLDPTSNGSDARDIEVRIRRVDGEIRWIRHNTWIVRDEAGVASRLDGVDTDVTERRAIQDALRQREEHFRALIEHSANVVALIDKNGLILYESPALMRVRGFSTAEMSGQNSFDFVHPDDIATIQPTFQTILATPNTPINMQGRVRRKDNSYIWIEAVVTNLLDNPEVGAIVINYTDISERKTAEEALYQSQAQLRAVLANLPVTLVVTDRNGVITLFEGITDLDNPAGRPETYLGKPSSDAAQILPNWEHLLTRAMSGERFNEVVEYNDQTIDIYFSPIIDATGQHNGNIAVAVNVTEQATVTRELEDYRQALEGLVESLGDIVDERTASLVKANESLQREIEERKQAQQEQQKLVSLVETSTELIAMVSLDGDITYINPAGARLVGLDDPRDAGSTQLNDYFMPESWKLLRRTIIPELPISRYWEGEIQIKHLKSGVPIDMLFNLFFIWDAQTGEPICYATVSHDITKNKQAERALRWALERERELSDLKSAFVSTVSHEFRTPLATIQTTTDVIRHYFDRMDEAQISAKFDKIGAQIKHMAMLLEDVSSMGRFTAGKVKFNPLLLDFDKFCQDVIDEMQQSKEMKHRLLYEHQGDDMAIAFDPQLMRQIITNLLSNAIKYSPPASDVLMRVESNPETILLSVVDQGIGIPEKDQAHLFEAFYRASNISNRPGSGLGLAISKQAIDLHGGTITFQSKPNVGTTFFVSIPRLSVGDEVKS